MFSKKKELLAVARGDKRADLVLENVRIVDLYNAEIIVSDLAIHGDRIIGWGDYQGKEMLDLQGRYILPGLIDSHLHLESSMVLPDEFCKQVVKRGTTTLIVDPHEVANVAGVEGIKFIQQYVDQLPINLYINLPSCVPPTSLNESGAVLKAEDLELLKDLPGIFGLGEVMDFTGVIDGKEDLLAKIDMMKGRFIDGHAPLLAGKELNAYLLAGIVADHEITDMEEVREKLSRGMYVMVREGSLAKDMLNLLPAIDKKNSRRFMLCTDDRHPTDLINEGHIDFMIKKAIQMGLEPIQAIRMVTLNPAECLGLSELGAIAPGMRADLIVVDDLHDFNIYQVYKDGQLLVENYQLLKEIDCQTNINLEMTVNVDSQAISTEELTIPKGEQYRVIQVLPGQLLTEEVIQPVAIEDGRVLEPGIAKVVVVERHKGLGQVGVGLVKGFGLEGGAFGSSIAHDSHNLIIVGRDDKSILAVVEGLIREQGGIAVAYEGQVVDFLPLPVAGLISDKDMDWVDGKLNSLNKILKFQGVTIAQPFMSLSFLALPVIPRLKMTSMGLFDINKDELVSVVVK